MEWKNIKEQKPSKSGKYLCYTDSGWVTTLNWSAVHEAFNASDWKNTAEYAVKVSHWCTLEELNLPELDEDKEDEE